MNKKDQLKNSHLVRTPVARKDGLQIYTLIAGIYYGGRGKSYFANSVISSWATSPYCVLPRWSKPVPPQPITDRG